MVSSEYVSAVHVVLHAAFLQVYKSPQEWWVAQEGWVGLCRMGGPGRDWMPQEGGRCPRSGWVPQERGGCPRKGVVTPGRRWVVLEGDGWPRNCFDNCVNSTLIYHKPWMFNAHLIDKHCLLKRLCSVLLVCTSRNRDRWSAQALT